MLGLGGEGEGETSRGYPYFFPWTSFHVLRKGLTQGEGAGAGHASMGGNSASRGGATGRGVRSTLSKNRYLSQLLAKRTFRTLITERRTFKEL